MAKVSSNVATEEDSYYLTTRTVKDPVHDSSEYQAARHLRVSPIADIAFLDSQVRYVHLVLYRYVGASFVPRNHI